MKPSVTAHDPRATHALVMSPTTSQSTYIVIADVIALNTPDAVATFSAWLKRERFDPRAFGMHCLCVPIEPDRPDDRDLDGISPADGMEGSQ